jgi:hypothetical protein
MIGLAVISKGVVPDNYRFVTMILSPYHPLPPEIYEDISPSTKYMF